MKNVFILIFILLCVSVLAQDWEIFESEPIHDAFMGTTTEQIGVTYHDPDFRLVMFFYNQRTSKESVLKTFGLALSGEWIYSNFYLKFGDEVVELLIVGQEPVYGSFVATNAIILIDAATMKKILRMNEDIQARMTYSALGLDMNYDFVIPKQIVEKIKQLNGAAVTGTD